MDKRNWCDLKKTGWWWVNIGQEHLADPTNKLIILKTRLNATMDKNEKNNFHFSKCSGGSVNERVRLFCVYACDLFIR